MTEVTTRATETEAPTLSIAWRYRLPALVGVLVIVGLTVVTTPYLLWAYNVERAGRLMEQGLAWPEPRQVDSVPQARDEEALADALGHLAAAIRWRSDHFHAYRLAGHVYAAQGDWERAAEALQQAHHVHPDNPMPAWEAGLVYERLWQTVVEAPATAVDVTPSAEAIEAPTTPIETPYCRDGAPETCYVGATTFTQPYAGLDEATVFEAPVLFVHPPARVRHSLDVPADRSGLRFLLGLDPATRGWGTDGATFQLWVEPQDGPAALVYERTLSGETAVAGWVPGWADLSPWSGERVTLVFGTAPGPRGDGGGDWFGWGSVALTTTDAARAYARAPYAGMIRAWRAAGVDQSTIAARSGLPR